ncbi:MAG: sensor histidine kinase [Pseudomonadales bacterium]
MKHQSQSFRYRLTLTFSVLAAIILCVQLGTFYTVVRVSEDQVLHKKLALYAERARAEFSTSQQRSGPLQIDLLTRAYSRFDTLPIELKKEITAEWSGSQEINIVGSDTEYMLFAAPMTQGSENFYIAMDITSVESSPLQRATWTGSYLLLSIALFALALAAVYLLARRLTSPLDKLSQQLKTAVADDLPTLECDPQAVSEIQQLCESINCHRSRISQLIARERAFTRYASHELRSPLTVIKGVCSLLNVSREPEFLLRQHRRLESACSDMHNLIETFLLLAREEQQLNSSVLTLDNTWCSKFIEEHRHLSRNTPVSLELQVLDEVTLQASEAVVRIALSNLLRNAIDNTDQGRVQLIVGDNTLQILDSGCGLGVQRHNANSTGLGLLIVRDICAKYGWHFTLQNNADATGCCAIISLPPKDNLSKRHILN